MKGQAPLKIVVTGPESTGKSSLCAELARRYDTLWCPEYARSYLEEKQLPGHQYTREDLLAIAKGQLKAEDQYLARAQQRKDPYLFIDTDMFVMQVWSEVAFQQCDPYILAEVASRQYDYYLLCNTDLPWAADPLREYPEEKMRQKLFYHYHDLLSAQNVPFGIVSGLGAARVENALSLLEMQFTVG